MSKPQPHPTQPASDSPTQEGDTPDPNSNEEHDPTSIPQEPSDEVGRGSFNVCVGVLGAPGTGKSTYALALAMEYAKRPCYVFAHDLGFKLKETLPKGTPTGIVRHGSFDDVRARLSSDPGGIHCIATEDAGAVIEFAKQVSAASMATDDKEGVGVPSLVLIDEAVSATDMDTYRLGEGIRNVISLRRHYNVGLIWTSQSAGLVNWKIMALGTELVCFRMNHGRDLDMLSKAGLSDEELQTISKLRRFHYIVHRFL